MTTGAGAHFWRDGVLAEGTPPAPRPFGLLETIGATAGRLPLWPRHLLRLTDCARRLGWRAELPPDLKAAAATLLAQNGHRDDILRLCLDEQGGITLSSRRRARGAPVHLIPTLSRRPTDAPPPDLKTTDRQAYHAVLAEARHSGADDGIILGPGGTVLETAVGNLWLCLDDQWVTPRADGAILPGVARQLLLEQEDGGAPTREARCQLGDLFAATALVVSNAVHGVREARLLGRGPGDAAPVRSLRARFATALGRLPDGP